jgi:murein L,D-transpeptidase YafK
MNRVIRLLVAPAVLCGLLLQASAIPAADRWLLVDTGERTLSVMEGELILRSFENISIGRDGASRTRFLGGQQTPLGTYRISSLRKETRYHRFFGINYPSLQDALRAYEAGLLSSADLEAIRTAQEHGREPPISTPLGGNIGIHGLGNGSPDVHADYNWTDGCIAVTNDQADELAEWVRLGMTVIIL